jgi:hypothetical protein
MLTVTARPSAGNIGNPEEIIFVPEPLRAPMIPMQPIKTTPQRAPVTAPQRERELVPVGPSRKAGS